MSGSLGLVKECDAGSSCKGISSPARLRQNDLRHAESLRTGYCSECRKYYGDRLPQKKVEAGSPVSQALLQPEVYAETQHLQDELSSFSEEEKKARRSHDALVALATAQPREEDLLDDSAPLQPLPSASSGAGSELLSHQTYYQKMVYNLSEEDEQLLGHQAGAKDKKGVGEQASAVELEQEEDEEIVAEKVLELSPASPFRNIFQVKNNVEKIGKPEKRGGLSDLTLQLTTERGSSNAAIKKRQEVSPLRIASDGLHFRKAEDAVLIDAESVAPEMSDDYKEKLFSAARAISGSAVTELEDAVALVAAHARKNNLMHVDIIAATKSFDGIVERHRTAEMASIATALMFNENLVVVDIGGGSIEAVIRASQEENLEYHLVKAVSGDRPAAEIGAGLRGLISQLSKFPNKTTSGRLVLITNLSNASPVFKRELIDAMISRKIGPYPVPAGVRIAIAESGSLDSEDFPQELVMQSICIPVKTLNASAADELIYATEQRRRLYEQQIKQAEIAGDSARVQRLQELAKKSSYVGAWLPGAGADGAAKVPSVAVGPDSEEGSANAEARQRELELDQRLDALVTKSGGYSRHDKASLITDITVPERSRFRRQVAERLLAGVYGREFSHNAMVNYIKQTSGPMAGKATIEDVIAGLSSIDDVRQTLKDSVYMTFIAIELRTSVVVDGLMRRGGEEAQKLQQIFMAVADRDPRTAAAIVDDRPYFMQVKKK